MIDERNQPFIDIKLHLVDVGVLTDMGILGNKRYFEPFPAEVGV